MPPRCIQAVYPAALGLEFCGLPSHIQVQYNVFKQDQELQRPRIGGVGRPPSPEIGGHRVQAPDDVSTAEGRRGVGRLNTLRGHRSARVSPLQR